MHCTGSPQQASHACYRPHIATGYAEERMREHGVQVNYATINRWVIT